jgi:hypothetical protein
MAASGVTNAVEPLPPKEANVAGHVEYFDEKRERGSASTSVSHEGEKSPKDRLQTARDLVAEVLDLDDDPQENPWTFRMWFLGIGVSGFGGWVRLYLSKNMSGQLPWEADTIDFV